MEAIIRLVEECLYTLNSKRLTRLSKLKLYYGLKALKRLWYSDDLLIDELRKRGYRVSKKPL
jgi:hypothetical protein